MAFKDRTQEFNSVAETARTKQSNVKSSGGKKVIRNQRTQFAIIASQIGKDIFETSEKLNKLTKLAKKRSLFDDPAVEIEELTFIIKQNIVNLNKQIATLREFSKSKGASNKQNEAHSDTIVSYLNSKLAVTTKDFKDILQVRTENLKTQQERRQRFTGSNTALANTSTPPKSPSDSIMYKASALEDLQESPQRGDGHVALVIQTQQDYTSSRVTAVENIERIMAELGGIFQQLASLVAQQGDMIARIDDNTTTTLDNVERGHDQLLKYLYNISSNRMLIVKLFLVLIVFAVIFIVFFV